MFTAELTALKTASPSADNILLSVWDGTQLRGALVRTPPFALLTSGLPTLVAPEVARVLAQAGYDIASIQGLTRQCSRLCRRVAGGVIPRGQWS